MALCCWNEEKKEWYDVISIGSDKFMCINCKQKYSPREMEEW